MSFGTASDHYAVGVELLNETRGPPACRLQSNSEYHSDYSGSETAGDNLRWSKGKQPSPPAKVPNSCSVLKEV